ncbi:hypothetical protein LEP1GSC008_3289 [Leptospira kirschneri serovar Bulgarica str. Nikolaevo]|uniref:Uncharacterized protein n=1 Tax=Leptospira kirschneri serovar Bulgarica str. Nikolaevo TaxID=1240687 RepID=M6F059_9LEPT|nr:hypothetical protein LEP1GSC008_3289 [Leptospira kirschneri serovar Bulgarica str. Nikolaevo]
MCLRISVFFPFSLKRIVVTPPGKVSVTESLDFYKQPRP